MTSDSPVPPISIGLPVFNGERHLSEAVLSILNQDFRDFELVISDNDSNDSTREIVEKFAALDSRIKYIRQPTNIGAIENFNFLLRNARSKYFMWAAADDTCHPSMLGLLYRTMEADERLALGCCSVQSIDEDGTPLARNDLTQIALEKVNERWVDVQKLFFRNPTTDIFFAIYGLYRRPSIEGIYLRSIGRERHATGSEIPFLAEVSTRGRIGCIGQHLKYYRWNKGSVYHTEQLTTSSMRQLRHYLHISEILLAVLVRSNIAIRAKIATTLKIAAFALVTAAKHVLRQIFASVRNLNRAR
jgi:glycosyltransferase involved in cell wall biosynthesis